MWCLGLSMGTWYASLYHRDSEFHRFDPSLKMLRDKSKADPDSEHEEDILRVGKEEVHDWQTSQQDIIEECLLLDFPQ